MPIQVLLADDHLLVRQALRTMLEGEGFQVTGEAADGREAVGLALGRRPNVVVLDFAMPLLNGLDAAREILRTGGGMKAILLTKHSEEAYVLEALLSGVHGYVLKTQAAADLIRAIHEVSRGAIYLSPGISRTVVEAYRAKSTPPPDPLSPREREVLQLIGEGKTTKEIASILGVSVKTAESHRMHIISKLNIHQTAGLVRYAIRQGLVEP